MEDLTEKERDFIETLRNYKRSYPNGIGLKFYLDQLYAELLDE